MSAERVKIYGMLMGSILSIKTLRTVLNSVVPLMAADATLGLSAAEAATLLSSFYPGYLLTQMPAGPIVQRFGGKPVMSISLLGTGLIFLCAPRAMDRGGVALLGALLGVLGLLQGPMSPCQAQLNRDWVPQEGSERAVVLRVQGLAHTSAPMLATLVTPFLARRGWRYVFTLLGGTVTVFSVLWQLIVSNRPPTKPTPTAAKTAEPLPPSPAGEKKPPAPTTPATSLAADPKGPVGPEWRIFTLPSVIALVGWQVASNFLLCVHKLSAFACDV